MHVILESIVGSKLHGTDNETSDTDLRKVFVEPTEQLFCWGYDYRKSLSKSGIVGEDLNSWSITRFCELSLNGNHNTLEVLLAVPVHATWFGGQLKSLFPYFLQKQRVWGSGRGFVKKQLEVMLSETSKRREKSASHYLRVLYNTTELLETGTFTCRIVDTPIGQEVLAAKAGVMSFEDVLKLGQELEVKMNKALDNSKLPDHADIDKVNKYLIGVRRAYL